MILIFAFDFPPKIGGIHTYSYEIAKHFSEHEKIVVLTPHATGDDEIDQKLNYKIISYLLIISVFICFSIDYGINFLVRVCGVDILHPK
ncbi:hypothetical protein B6V01_002815 [Methanosarcinales archaeon ex4572_44]|nr:MAG: hypothetical protein B6V01_002815 [Methanosarcinales archaeon ex4572_44]RLG25918.1 MAG: hypothetical protein DRN85_04495 [Methanosarcinales archaeon]